MAARILLRANRRAIQKGYGAEKTERTFCSEQFLIERSGAHGVYCYSLTGPDAAKFFSPRQNVLSECDCSEQSDCSERSHLLRAVHSPRKPHKGEQFSKTCSGLLLGYPLPSNQFHFGVFCFYPPIHFDAALCTARCSVVLPFQVIVTNFTFANSHEGVSFHRDVKVHTLTPCRLHRVVLSMP